jgi:hypothetical protein
METQCFLWGGNRIYVATDSYKYRAPHSSSSTCGCHQKDKWAKCGNFQKALLFWKSVNLDRKVLSLTPILSEMNQVYTIPYYFIKIHLNIIPLHMSRTSEVCLVRLFGPFYALYFKMAKNVRLPILTREKQKKSCLPILNVDFLLNANLWRV